MNLYLPYGIHIYPSSNQYPNVSMVVQKMIGMFKSQRKFLWLFVIVSFVDTGHLDLKCPAQVALAGHPIS
jgi:hypothetical protein